MLGVLLAFILSQDQTLHKKRIATSRKIWNLAILLCYSTYYFFDCSRNATITSKTGGSLVKTCVLTIFCIELIYLLMNDRGNILRIIKRYKHFFIVNLISVYIIIPMKGGVNLLSHAVSAQYHWLWRAWLLCSEWEQVFPLHTSAPPFMKTITSPQLDRYIIFRKEWFVPRAISTSLLNSLLSLYMKPIKPVVYRSSYLRITAEWVILSCN